MRHAALLDSALALLFVPTSHVPAPRRVDQSKIITEMLKLPPAALVVTRWSSRLLASQVGVDHATVPAISKAYGVHERDQPRLSS